jgi:hypothetical protein
VVVLKWSVSLAPNHITIYIEAKHVHSLINSTFSRYFVVMFFLSFVLFLTQTYVQKLKINLW